MPEEIHPPYKEPTMKRKPVNKRRSARQFRKNVSRTKAANVKHMRGGYRL